MNTNDIQSLIIENEKLKNELEDLKIINENTIEHSTYLENELFEQNNQLDILQKKMKKYLSPQLYKSLVGGTEDAAIKHTRKKLTVFFSDIADFSEITDSIESELLSDVLNQYLNKMADIATKWGGTIDKFIGDAVMVFFGDPEYIDDATHAKKCVKMALEMLEELEVLREKWKEAGLSKKLRIRIGINSGFCTVGNFGSVNRMDYTIIGGQVNIASRLENLAEPDTIFISNPTYSLIEDEIDCEYVDDLKVKGIHYPVEVYRVIGIKGQNKHMSSLMQKTKDGFLLKEIEYSESLSTKKEKENIKAALESALESLNKGE